MTNSEREDQTVQSDISQIIAEDENEDYEAEDDEAYGAELHSYTTSLASSVTDHKWVHGRRFHSYREGNYMFPNDEKEQDRLDMFHHMFKLALGGKLFLAPVHGESLRVLDIGTGTGIWAIDMADTFPSVEMVIGNDLSPIQPRCKRVPPNVQFEVDDVEAEWPERPPFDLIHSRYMCGSISDWPRLFEQAYNQTKIGGWVEFQDFHLVNYSQDGSLKEENNVNRFYELLREACEKMNRSITVGVDLVKWAEEAGFSNVKHKVFPLPLGTWPRDQKMKEIGAFNMLQFLEGLEAFSIATFTQVLGWSHEEVQVFLALVRKDARDRTVHMMHDL
ncbi:hypothetical protein TCE0_011r00535 [Talaromyces pinophilus]|uniref:S-adenosyl-L-methionine-dependent methyltransferase n=1 Tax=Talaromyces pinophilus TaxID=128442 RepID=A0A0B8MXJ8_TALPI|nr:hypothetical protein TCE0_011r00535 [Talaromyces pinophilus]